MTTGGRVPGTRHHGPGERDMGESVIALVDEGLADAVALPDLQRDGVEAVQQLGQLPRHATIDALFIDHMGSSPRVSDGAILERDRAARQP